MTGKDLTIVGICIAVGGSGVGWAMNMTREMGEMGADVRAVKQDVSEIKNTLALIAPPTVAGKTSTAQAVAQ